VSDKRARVRAGYAGKAWAMRGAMQAKPLRVHDGSRNAVKHEACARHNARGDAPGLFANTDDPHAVGDPSHRV
jgi:hypothetical protein